MSATILVTGANSFIGGWIVKYLLDKGYHVRGAVRSQAKESQVLDAIPTDQQSRISFVHIGDIASDSFDEAVKGVDGIIHVASPVLLTATNPEKEILLPAINGTVGVLEAAHKYNQNSPKKINRIVITSSTAAIIDLSEGLRPDYVYTEKDWCPLTYEDGRAANDNIWKVYQVAKTCAERSAWDFLEKKKPSFTIATICAPMVFGPRINGFNSINEINATNLLIWSLITSGKDAQMPEPLVPIMIDVQDMAYAHVAALERCLEKSERYIIVGGIWSPQKVADLVHESVVIPEKIKSTTPIGTKGEQIPPHYTIESFKAQKDLGITYIPLKKTIEDLILHFVQLQEKLEHA